MTLKIALINADVSDISDSQLCPPWSGFFGFKLAEISNGQFGMF
jgi:hypothetical protein